MEAILRTETQRLLMGAVRRNLHFIRETVTEAGKTPPSLVLLVIAAILAMAVITVVVECVGSRSRGLGRVIRCVTEMILFS